MGRGNFVTCPPGGWTCSWRRSTARAEAGFQKWDPDTFVRSTPRRVAVLTVCPLGLWSAQHRWKTTPISTEVAVNAIPKGIPPASRIGAQLPEVTRDETSRASPAVIQAGARRATRGRIGYSESAVLLLLQRLCSGRRACGRKFRDCRKHDTA